jgi:hypothetical protein
MMTADVQPGEVVLVHAGEKLRPAVVVRVMSPPGGRVKLLALWGTGTLRPERAPIGVLPRTAAGVALGIEKPTYFYRGNVAICETHRAQRTGRRCPPELLLQLSSLVGL